MDGLLALTWKITKQYDTTRPCIDTSGNFHVVTDIFDVHDYEQDPEKFAAILCALSEDTPHGLSRQMNQMLISFHEPDNERNQVLYCRLGNGDKELVNLSLIHI